jgi:hypothetical protein
MKIHHDVTINGKKYKKGDRVSDLFIYPFFMIHMAMFGGSGFFMAYGSEGPPSGFIFLHGGFAIVVYLMFYRTFFGVDQVKWMFINAGLGILGLVSQIGWLLSLFGRQLSDYPWYAHIIPFLYFILYTFLLRQAFLDLFRARNNEKRQRQVENVYVGLSLLVYLLTLAA